MQSESISAGGEVRRIAAGPLMPDFHVDREEVR